MTKKYRQKKNPEIQVELLCVSDKAHYPVVYQYPYSDTWFISVTHALGTANCAIEEVPEVTVEVGDVFQHNEDTEDRVLVQAKTAGRASILWLRGKFAGNPRYTLDSIDLPGLSGYWKKVGKIVYDN